MDTKQDIYDEDLVEVDVSELGAICSNLSKACEKQYLNEEMKLFNELSSYFNSISPIKETSNVEKLLELINKDIESYKGLKDYCIENNDRGAARVAVWGERVTRMLQSLVVRYLKEGETLLLNTSIYVCSVCGFVYIGDNPPEKCPVCGVPSYKFEKIKGQKK